MPPGRSPFSLALPTPPQSSCGPPALVNLILSADLGNLTFGNLILSAGVPGLTSSLFVTLAEPDLYVMTSPREPVVYSW